MTLAPTAPLPTRDADLDHDEQPLLTLEMVRDPGGHAAIADAPSPGEQMKELAGAIERRVGRQRFDVWFQKSTRLDLRGDRLEIAVANDFIGEWIGRHFTQPIQEAASEVLGCSLPLKFRVTPDLFEATPVAPPTNMRSGPSEVKARAVPAVDISAPRTANQGFDAPLTRRPRLRHDLSSYVVGSGNQMAYQCAAHVAEFPGSEYNPLFIHGNVGLGKTHLLQGLCKEYARRHPTGRWIYLTGEQFTNEFLMALRSNRLDGFRRRMRDLDLLVIDDVHFLGGKRATQEEFLHTFNAIEAVGKQVVLASDNHPKLIESFGESLVSRFVSGMVVRVDPPTLANRKELATVISQRSNIKLSQEVIDWVAARVTQNVRELEGAITRIRANVELTGREPNVELARECLLDLDRAHAAPIQPEMIMDTICEFFALERKDLMSGRRQRTVSLARSVAMYLIRKTSKLSFPEIANRLGKRNHSTVISACRRVEKALQRDEMVTWTSSVGEREEKAQDLVNRLEEQARANR